MTRLMLRRTRRDEGSCVSNAGRLSSSSMGCATHVVSTSDPDDVALELISERVNGDLLGHALLVEDAAVRWAGGGSASREGARVKHNLDIRPALVIDLNGLLLPGGRVGKVELHAVKGDGVRAERSASSSRQRPKFEQHFPMQRRLRGCCSDSSAASLCPRCSRCGIATAREPPTPSTLPNRRMPCCPARLRKSCSTSPS